MKPYPKYKDSGIEWVGEIPENWELKRLKYVVDMGKEETDALEGYDFRVALENIESNTGRLLSSEGTFEGKGNIFNSGDVLFNKLRPYLAKVYQAQQEGVAVGELLVLRPQKGVDSRFMFHRLISSPFISVVNSSSYGVKMPRASWSFMGSLRIALPHTSEQQSIASFLDRKTKQIDGLIEKKQSQIDLLREQRAAVINEAVTKGLNPKAKMKDSGIEWIGEIPEHWLFTKVGRVMNLGRGRVISHEEIGDNAGEYPVYSSQTDNNGVMGCLNTYDFEGDYVTWTTDGANAGRVFFRTGRFNCTNVCGTMQPKNEDVFLPYMPYLLNLGTKYYVRYDINPKMMNGMMAKIDVCLPPLPEQQAITSFLDHRTSEYDTMMTKEERLIELLQEYRTSLISEVVTGKVDVRNEN